MPSLYKRKSQAGTTWNLQLNELPGRPRVALGRCTKATAEQFRLGVVALLGAHGAGGQLDARTAAWMKSLPDNLRLKLHKSGLLAGYAQVPTIGELCAQHLRDHVAHLRPSTQKGYRIAADLLCRGFGPSTLVDRISTTEAR
jgi:hypothetical protein